MHCGSSPAAHINNTTKGISIKCHRCDHTDFVAHSGLSFADIMRMRQKADELRGYRVRPDTVPLAEGPEAAWLWVLKAGLSPERATEQYGIRWIPKYDRILIPILEQGEDTGGWIARSLIKGVPKYVASVSAAGKHWISRDDGSQFIVVVEDVLSAIAVDRAGFMVVAAMGTAFPVGLLGRISNVARRVQPWLDNDMGGLAGTRGLRKAARQWPVTVLPSIKTELDPKRYSASQIREIITKG